MTLTSAVLSGGALAGQTSGLPDVVVEAIRWSDNDGSDWHPMSEDIPVGQNILFQVDVRNQGTSATPNGVILGVLFMQSTGAGFAGVSWTDTHTTPLGAGSSITLTANGGPDGDPYWTPTSAGGATIRAWVDDPNRFPELDENNNILDVPVTVVSTSGLQPPSQAAAAGYTELVFQEEFDDYSGIDVNDSRAAGFNFYRNLPFGEGVNPMSNIVVSNSVLTLTGGPAYNMALVSTASLSTGFAATGGAYFECSMRFELDQPPPGPPTIGWPAFWSMANEHLWGNASYWIECDIFEKWDDSQGFYINAAHIWGSTRADTQFSPGIPGGWNWTQFHTHGCLWLPGDRWRWYRDNAFTGERVYSSFPWLAQGDSQSWPIILGSHVWPMEVDWVRVWAAP
jgi:CARDB